MEKDMNYYLGVDVGSVSTNLVLINNDEEVIDKIYIRTSGQPIRSIKHGMRTFAQKYDHLNIRGVGTTGSARQLAGVLVGADIIKNEITAHAVAALKLVRGAQTILEIGGQDSKIIILRDGIVTDFAMNTVCAAGTGSFLDRQAARMEIPISEFGGFALKSKSPVRIAGRCAVFAESDMIHKQQTGHSIEDIVGGLCEALVRNYLANLAKGKPIEDTVVFQGGVAANVGIVSAFERTLEKKVVVPEHFDVMGAVGAAFLARQKMKEGQDTRFKGFQLAETDFKAKSIDCSGCSNLCEVIEIVQNGKIIARWGDRCGKWSGLSIVEKDTGICYN